MNTQRIERFNCIAEELLDGPIHAQNDQRTREVGGRETEQITEATFEKERCPVTQPPAQLSASVACRDVEHMTLANIMGGPGLSGYVHLVQNVLVRHLVLRNPVC